MRLNHRMICGEIMTKDEKRRFILSLFDEATKSEWATMPGTFLGVDPDGKTTPIKLGMTNINAVLDKISSKVYETYGNKARWESREIKKLESENLRLQNKIWNMEQKLEELRHEWA